MKNAINKKCSELKTKCDFLFTILSYSSSASEENTEKASILQETLQPLGRKYNGQASMEHGERINDAASTFNLLSSYFGHIRNSCRRKVRKIFKLRFCLSKFISIYKNTKIFFSQFFFAEFTIFWRNPPLIIEGNIANKATTDGSIFFYKNLNCPRLLKNVK